MIEMKIKFVFNWNKKIKELQSRGYKLKFNIPYVFAYFSK